MSSAEEEGVSRTSEVKGKRKKQRACDHCRRKKIRCDGPDMPNKRCSRCISNQIDCTYDPINTRPPSKSYVQLVETRLQNLEKLFAQLHPEIELPKDLDVAPETLKLHLTNKVDSLHLPSTSSPRKVVAIPIVSAVTPPPPDSPSIHSDELESSDHEVEARQSLLENLKRNTPMHLHPAAMRYYGKSSNLLFLQTVIDLKEEYTGIAQKTLIADRGENSNTEPPEQSWPWLYRVKFAQQNRPPHTDFPEDDYMAVLIDAYFSHVNVYLPLLHRPTFERRLRDKIHLEDQAFGSVVLLVCANGSRWTSDARADNVEERVRGWKWFEPVEINRWSLLIRPTVEDLQACALSAIYLGSTHASQGSWIVVGLGLRMAQDIGAHRKKMYSAKPTVEDELRRRAFWVLVALDRIGSFGLGRPCAIHNEDVDVDPITECDDEYWDNSDPDLMFKQPEGKPSTASFAACFSRLLKILAFASRTIYSITKGKLTLGFVGPEWEHKIVAELDSALNKWADTVPDHLKWDPNRGDEVLMNQSATLYANYYLVQICVHRPFIRSSRKAPRLPFPSLAICTNAARSCTHVMDIQFQRNQTSLLLNRLPLFTSGLVLLLNMWGGKRSGLSNQANIADIHKCMHMLQKLELHTHAARRLWDILNGLLSIGELAPPGKSLESSEIEGPTPSDELRRGESNTMADTSNTKTNNAQLSGLSPFYKMNPPPEPIHEKGTMVVQTGHDVQMDTSFVLPVYTEELGRVPFHYGFSPPRHAPTAQAHQQTYSYGGQEQGVLDLFQAVASPSVATQDGTASGPTSDGSDGHGFQMSLTDYSELLSAMSFPPATSSSSGAADGMATSSSALSATSPDVQPSADMADISMMSMENLMFADNMMEVWSTAPTSLEWDDWGAYVTSMGGTNNVFNESPRGF